MGSYRVSCWLRVPSFEKWQVENNRPVQANLLDSLRFMLNEFRLIQRVMRLIATSLGVMALTLFAVHLKLLKPYGFQLEI